MHILINKKYLNYYKYKVKCSVGKRGIGYKKKEGDLITPVGLYRIKYILYRKDRIKHLKTKIKTIAIKKNMGWCNDSKSKKYNQLIRYPFKFNSERLYRSDNIYDMIIVLNFNMSPVKKNKGSAIFIHVAKNKFSSTKGCIALKKNELKKMIKFLTKTTLVKII